LTPSSSSSSSSTTTTTTAAAALAAAFLGDFGIPTISIFGLLLLGPESNDFFDRFSVFLTPFVLTPFLGSTWFCCCYCSLCLAARFIVLGIVATAGWILCHPKVIPIAVSIALSPTITLPWRHLSATPRISPLFSFEVRGQGEK